MVEDTSIKIKKETRDMLNSLKVHSRQGYDEVIKKLIQTYLSRRKQ